MSENRVLQGSGPARKPAGTTIVTDPLEIRRLFSRASEGGIQATVKVRGSDTVLKTKVLEADAQRGLELSIEPGEGQLNLENLEKLGATKADSEFMILMHLEGRYILGVNTRSVEMLKDRITFSAGTKVFKIQRRKDVRYAIPAGYEFTVEIESLERTRARVKKRLVDLSESGLSFFVLSPREAALYRKGMILNRCIIKIQNYEIPVILRVCNRGKHDRGKQGSGNKIGTEFEQISAENRDYIAQFVYSHAQHLFY